MGKLEPPLPLCLCFLNPNVTETLTGHDGYENDNMHWSLDSCQVPILFGVLQSLGEWKVLDIFSVIFWIRKEILGSCCLIQKGFTYWALNRQEKKPTVTFQNKEEKNISRSSFIIKKLPSRCYELTQERAETSYLNLSLSCSFRCSGLPPCILQSPSKANWTN